MSFKIIGRDDQGGKDSTQGLNSKSVVSGGGGGNIFLDPFGILKLYPTSGGKEYYTRTDATSTADFQADGRTGKFSGFSRNADGSWKISGSPRWFINGGWRNYEMTGQIKINSGDQISFYGNGEKHSGTMTNPQDSWHGCKNGMRIYANGNMGFVKELYHESGGNTGYANTIAKKTGTSILGKWATVKFVSYNVNNNTHRKLEGYVSINNNDNIFRKVTEYTDTGSWSVSNVSGFNAFMAAAQQKSPATIPRNRDTGGLMRPNEVITWAGQWVSVRCDSADYDFRNISVREIDALQGYNPGVVVTS